MTIPDFQFLMLPILRLNEDSNEHTITEMFDKLGELFKLSDDDRRALLPSGRQSKFENRVHWAKTFLQKACLLEATGRARLRVTLRGQQVLKQNPSEIDNKFLQQYPEFIEFRKREAKVEKPEHEEEQKENTKPPLEILEYSIQNLRQSLAQELLETVKGCRPQFFENLVVDLLLAMGYGGSRRDTGSAIGRTGDGGVDGIIKKTNWA